MPLQIRTVASKVYNLARRPCRYFLLAVANLTKRLRRLYIKPTLPGAAITQTTIHARASGNCKHCHGKGWIVTVVGRERIGEYCSCVLKDAYQRAKIVYGSTTVDFNIELVRD